MSLFFQDSHEIKLPPEEVRLISVRVTPSIPGVRVKIELELTPFQKRPNVEVTITDPAGTQVAQTTIVETILSNLEFTMHIREAEADGEYLVETRLYYQPIPPATDAPVEIELPEPMVVDQKSTKFIFAKSSS